MREGRDVIDQVDAGLSGAAHDLRLAGIDGEPRTCAWREGLDDGADTAPFLLEIDRVGAGPRRFPADVENVGALRLELQRMRDGRVACEVAPAVGKAVGGDVDNAHDARAIEREAGNRCAGSTQGVQEVAQSVDTAGESFGRGHDATEGLLRVTLDHLHGGEGEIAAAGNRDG